MRRPGAKITLRDLARGVDFDAFAGSQMKNAVFNDEGEAILSAALLDQLTQNSRDNPATWKTDAPMGNAPFNPWTEEWVGQPRQYNQMQQGYREPPAPQYEHHQPAPPQQTERVDAFKSAIGSGMQQARKAAPVQEAPSIPEIEYNAGGLLNKLSAIKEQATLHGKSVNIRSSSGVQEYILAIRGVMKAMSEATGMVIDIRGPENIWCYWQDEDTFTGFNRIYTGDPSGIAFALMASEDPNIEDDIKLIPFGDSIETFSDNVEAFFCDLFKKHLGI